jgi:Leucine-rich repeat (LRR) protein
MARDEDYREAEEKIEEARRSDATALDLSGMGLTEVPESLGQLTQLQLLNLSGNQVTTLPESLGSSRSCSRSTS